MKLAKNTLLMITLVLNMSAVANASFLESVMDSPQVQQAINSPEGQAILKSLGYDTATNQQIATQPSQSNANESSLLSSVASWLGLGQNANQQPQPTTTPQANGGILDSLSSMLGLGQPSGQLGTNVATSSKPELLTHKAELESKKQALLNTKNEILNKKQQLLNTTIQIERTPNIPQNLKDQLATAQKQIEQYLNLIDVELAKLEQALGLVNSQLQIK